MPSYTNIAKPTTAWGDVSKIASFLLINAVDFLLINTVDRLIIKDDGGSNYTSIAKPSTIYNSIVKPT